MTTAIDSGMSPMDAFDAAGESVDAAFGDGPPPGDMGPGPDGPMGPPPEGDGDQTPNPGDMAGDPATSSRWVDQPRYGR